MSYRVIYEARDESGRGTTLAESFRSSGDEKLREQLVSCTSCGLLYVNPRLNADLVLQGYAEGSDEVFVSQARSREETFVRSLDAIERHTNGDRGRILDIGTAGGAFLHVAAKRGWEVEGCEPNRWLCDWARKHYGLTITPGTVFDQHYPSGHFDVVTLWDVLEHAPDPKSVIAECHRLLKPGGLLVITCPDSGSWIARLMGRSWVFLLNVHLYYFTRQTLGRLLSDSGFRVAAARPYLQRLELGYILRRAQAYVGGIAHLAQRIVRALGLGKISVPYWAGQTFFVARKDVASARV